MRRKLFNDKSVVGSRRKLFSNYKPTRRKLFSDECECNEDKIVKCMDCGKEYKYSGSDLHLICTRCGSDRFEFVDNITSSDVVESGKENPIDRAFSEKRRKLFNDEKSSSLTSLNPGPEKELQKFKCPDCGTVFDSEEQYVDYATCPNCGGNRCRKIVDSDSCDCEENNFSDAESDKELDELLSKYKGKSVNEGDLEAELHALGIYDEVGGVKGLVDSGYATEDDGQVMFSDIADCQRRLFSKLVISVTKEFDIDPICNRESVIDSLADKFPGKPIMILKKNRSSVMPEISAFSDKSYLKDSGIESDIRVEYGGQSMSLKDFMNLLNEEYPDAPEDIVDLLESSNIIKINGGKVLISK